MLGKDTRSKRFAHALTFAGLGSGSWQGSECGKWSCHASNGCCSFQFFGGHIRPQQQDNKKHKQDNTPQNLVLKQQPFAQKNAGDCETNVKSCLGNTSKNLLGRENYLLQRTPRKQTYHHAARPLLWLKTVISCHIIHHTISILYGMNTLTLGMYSRCLMMVLKGQSWQVMEFYGIPPVSGASFAKTIHIMKPMLIKHKNKMPHITSKHCISARCRFSCLKMEGIRDAISSCSCSSSLEDSGRCSNTYSSISIKKYIYTLPV